MSPPIQVGALPIRQRADGTTEILLIIARGKPRWLIPKGGRSKRLSDQDAAAREALEEGGVRGTTKSRPIGRYRHRCEDGRKGPRIIVYKLKVSRHLSSWKEEGERRRRWLPASKAVELVREKSLRKLILAS
jgi:8-oxo-dGTP pyrophosphatase MutT (NUDIX family)